MSRPTQVFAVRSRQVRATPTALYSRAAFPDFPNTVAQASLSAVALAEADRLPSLGQAVVPAYSQAPLFRDNGGASCKTG